jgi:hypothetical protein
VDYAGVSSAMAAVVSLFFYNLDSEEYIAVDFGFDSASAMTSPRFVTIFWAKALSLDANISDARLCRF